MPRLKDIVVDCGSASRQALFWAAVVADYDIRPYDEAEIERLAALGLTPETDPAVMVDGPNGSMCFQEVREQKLGKNRVHLDLVSDDRRGDVDRLLSLGASVLSEHDDHTVLADPEGNEFCLYESG
jgi:Glyoxalase-like domain